MKYRPDIDGLRAIAIIPVVLYHAGLPVFSGGFVGVDVFFVISGYLITGLIHPEIAADRFSLATFYERRIRRIFPALFSVILASAAASLLLLPSDDMMAFGASVFAAAFFTSNILFARESGYFDAPAELKPLLHTWSLGVEEQFYLCFPAVLILLRRASAARLSVVVAAIALVSFACSVYYVRLHPGSAFYLGPWRVWELSLGVLVALGALPQIRSQVLRELAAVAGLGLIFWSVTGLSRADPFPGVNALYPCVGAFLVIVAGSGGRTVVNSLLATRLFVFVGLISYSLYLWHWPLIVFAKRLALRSLTGSETVEVVLLSLCVAIVSWRFIERPFRGPSGQRSRSSRIFVGAAVAMASSAVFAVAAWSAQGWPGRFPGQAVTHIRGREDYRAGTCFMDMDQTYPDWARSGPCLIDHHAAKTILIWGDSFGAHYIPGIERNPRAGAYNFLQYTAYSCPPVLGAAIPWAPKCRDVNASIDRVLDGNELAGVVVVARWERYWNKYLDAKALERTLEVLKKRGLPVVLVGQGPSFAFPDPADYVRRSGMTSAVPRDGSSINRELRTVADYDVFFDPTAAMCPNGRCAVKSDGEFLYWDDGHYSSFGSTIASDGLLEAIRSAVPPGTGAKPSAVDAAPRAEDAHRARP